MSGIQIQPKILSKTGTNVINVLKDGVKTSKIVIPGAGNSNPDLINCMTTTYVNGKAKSVIANLQHSNDTSSNYIVMFEKIYKNGKEMFERMR